MIAKDTVGNELQPGDVIAWAFRKRLVIARIEDIRYLVRGDDGRMHKVEQAAGEGFNLSVAPIRTRGYGVSDPLTIPYDRVCDVAKVVKV